MHRSKPGFVRQHIVDVSCAVVGLQQRASHRLVPLVRVLEAPIACGLSRFLIMGEISEGRLYLKPAHQ